MNIRTELLAHKVASCLMLIAALFLAGAPAATAQESYSLSIQKTDGQGETVGKLIPGVTFKINRLLDLSPMTQAELADLTKKDISILTDSSPYPMGPELTMATNEQGIAKFSNLEPGVYLVREMAYRIGNVDYLQATPFLVSVPEVGIGARNDVLVRTKNQPLPVAKQTDKFCVEQNDPALFTITTGVPEPDVTGRLYQYAIVDPLDPRVEYRGSLSVAIEGNGAQPLAEGTDYRRSWDEETRSIIIQFTESGLEKLAAARTGHPDTRVVTKFEATVQDWASIGDVVPNTAFLIPDGWGFDLKSHIYRPVGGVYRGTVTFAFADGATSRQVKPQFKPVLMPLPDNKVDDVKNLDAVSIPSNPVAICKCFPGQVVPPLPGIPGGPALPILSSLGVAGSSLSSDGSQQQERVTGAPTTQAAAPSAKSALDQVRRKVGLASTGANVWWLVLGAVVLALVGWWLIVAVRRRNKDSEEKQ
ncbi:SpaH/EbpB family LPXTG-anchored major pilin [Staphylococcus chromogenes]|nr:SpaH/EbpB family LPXTG-anchored major pilin [Staphylococcus chromogenes]